MGTSYSLEYYDRIFGSRTPAYEELLQALSEELLEYADSLGPTLEMDDPVALSRLRHAHRPLVENLGLLPLYQVEEDLRRAVEEGRRSQVVGLAARLIEEARAVAAELTSERLRGAREPRRPSPGG